MLVDLTSYTSAVTNKHYTEPVYVNFLHKFFATVLIPEHREYRDKIDAAINELIGMMEAMSDDQIIEIRHEVQAYECGWNPADILISYIEQRTGPIPYPDDM